MVIIKLFAMGSFAKKTIPLAIVAISIFAFGKICYGANGVIFSEISMGTSTNASDEFVELYNSSGSDIDLSGWQISYKSATGTTWTKKLLIDSGKIIRSNQYFLAASITQADAKLSSGLSQTGGNLRITDKSGNVVDQLAWGNGDKPLVQAASACQPSESLQRIYNTDGLGLQNTSNNFEDYDVSSSSTPGKAPQFDTQNQDTNQSDNSSTYPSLLISELYPDPGEGQSDSSDEFIEIYNPNDTDVNLAGWSLRDSGGTSYKFENITIGANSYYAVYSKDTPISLNNDGDTVTLLNPLAQTVDQTPNYGDAQEGLSWGLTPAGWGWVVSATPNSPNAGLYVFGQADSSKSKSKVKTSKSKKTSKINSSKKSAKSKLASVGKTPSSLSSEDEKLGVNKNLWNILLITLGLGTIGYGIYEYRTEIKTYYQIFRRKLGLGPKSS
jgi:hypothetical protein